MTNREIKNALMDEALGLYTDAQTHLEKATFSAPDATAFWSAFSNRVQKALRLAGQIQDEAPQKPSEAQIRANEFKAKAIRDMFFPDLKS